MTWIDLVKQYLPNATDKECDFILWEKTPFPISTDVKLIKNYLEIYVNEIKKGGLNDTHFNNINTIYHS